jgi:hypothetical protein
MDGFRKNTRKFPQLTLSFGQISTRYLPVRSKSDGQNRENFISGTVTCYLSNAISTLYIVNPLQYKIVKLNSRDGLVVGLL